MSNKMSLNPFLQKRPRVDSKSFPILTNFVQNKDGSLTGQIYNSKNFFDGDTVTTSTVLGAVKDGMVVTTATGSRYELEASSSGIKTQRARSSKNNLQGTNELRRSATFSLGQKKKPVPPANAPLIPTISNFKQNFDGSITGRVSNSKNFRNGTRITTTPVRKGAKAGKL